MVHLIKGIVKEEGIVEETEVEVETEVEKEEIEVEIEAEVEDVLDQGLATEVVDKMTEK